MPRIGQRILKTSIAVLICLLFYSFRGYRGEDMPTEAAITAIICMQPYVRDSREFAMNRLTATLIGTFWGLLLLLILLLFPILGTNLCVVYALMAVGVLMSLYTTVVFHKPDASSLAAIVFVCIVIAFPEIEDPIADTLERIFGVLIGMTVAIGVNVFRLPRGRRRNLVFFIRSSDLVPDRFSQVSPTVLFRLNWLYQEGARICLISRHAPAFVTSQLSAVTLNLPMIVMDGAALYDVNENRYLSAERIREADSRLLMEKLDSFEASYFLYTVHRNRTCIFHQGPLSEQEQQVLNQLRRTPYRTYLDEEIYVPQEIVCVKIVGEEAYIEQLKNRLYTFLLCRKLRGSIQPQTGVPGVNALYIYSDRATVHQAETRLMKLLQERESGWEAEEVFLSSGYRSEHDAMHLLYQIYNRFAPIRLFLPFQK